jgi:TrmH family RNA methyltransferase
LGEDLPEIGRQSARLREFRELRRASRRRTRDAFLIEGPNLFERLLTLQEHDPRFPYRLQSFLISSPYLERFQSLGFSARCAALGADGGRVGERTMESLSGTTTPPGVVAIVQPPRDAWDMEERVCRTASSRIVLAYGVSDPGNLGTLARSAAALGASAFVTAGGAEPFGPKALRASAGDCFALPYGGLRDPVAFLERLGGLGVRRIGAVSRGGQAPAALTIPERWVLVVGSETHGLPDAWDSLLDERVTIALERDVESLNAAVAGSILLHTLGRGGRTRGR